MKEYLVVVLICTPRMISDIEHFFMDLLVIHMVFFFEKCLLNSLLIFQPGFSFPHLFCFVAFELDEFLIYFVYKPLIRYVVSKYSFPLHRLPFILIPVQKFFNLI